MINLLKTKLLAYLYPIIAIVVAAAISYVAYLKISLSFAESKKVSLEKELETKTTELRLTIESIEQNQKIEDAKTKAETISKVNKESVLKTQKKLKETIQKRGVINENINDDFINFAF